MAFPRIKMAHYAQNELDTLPPEQRLAAYYGVPRDCLFYSEESYLDENQFRLYDSTLR